VTHQLVSAVEIGLAMHMTASNARHHLAILEEQGLVEVFSQRAPQGKGRPTNLYSLSEKVRGHNLDKLAHALLKDIFEELPQEELGGVLQRIADRMSEGRPSEAARKINRALTRQLNDAIRFLNDQNYLARWEAHADAPHVIFANCPYATILVDHPELCQLDVHLLESLLASPVRQIARLEHDSRGAPHCIFVVGRL